MEAYIKQATEQFEALLRQQLARCEKMKEGARATDFTTAEKIVIGSIFARAEDLFRPKMEEILKKECLGYNLQVCTVVPAQLGEAIGDIAAISVGVIGWEELQNV